MSMISWKTSWALALGSFPRNVRFLWVRIHSRNSSCLVTYRERTVSSTNWTPDFVPIFVRVVVPLEKLKTNHIEASPEQVASLVHLIKEYSESKSKVGHQAFIELFREREDRRRGITEEEFWLLARRAGLAVPPEHDLKFPRYSLEPPKETGTSLR